MGLFYLVVGMYLTSIARKSLYRMDLEGNLTVVGGVERPPMEADDRTMRLWRLIDIPASTRTE